jgi:hypothetical protein
MALSWGVTNPGTDGSGTIVFSAHLNMALATPDPVFTESVFTEGHAITLPVL